MENNKAKNGDIVNVNTVKVTCSSLLSNVQVENLSLDGLSLKNVDDSGTANDKTKSAP